MRPCEKDFERRGVVLIIAIVFLTIFATFLATTVASLNQGLHVSGRGLARSRLRQAVDHALEVSKFSPELPAEPQDWMHNITLKVSAEKMGPDRFRLTVTASLPDGPSCHATAELRRSRPGDETSGWKIVSYKEEFR